jgi:hypothetical protein
MFCALAHIHLSGALVGSFLSKSCVKLQTASHKLAVFLLDDSGSVQSKESSL